jgi:hypothetical protein
MQLKTTLNEIVDLTNLTLEEAVPEHRIEIYRDVQTQQFYIRHLDGRFEPVACVPDRKIVIPDRE